MFPEKGSACDKALAEAIRALIPIITLVTYRPHLLAVLLHEKSHPRLDDFFVDVVTISATNTGVWSRFSPQKPIVASHRCGSLFFYVFIVQHFSA